MVGINVIFRTVGLKLRKLVLPEAPRVTIGILNSVCKKSLGFRREKSSRLARCIDERNQTSYFHLPEEYAALPPKSSQLRYSAIRFIGVKHQGVFPWHLYMNYPLAVTRLGGGGGGGRREGVACSTSLSKKEGSGMH